MVKQNKRTMLHASMTVEAAYLYPVILVVWMFVLFGLFYYHDKTILAGAAYETAAAGSAWIHEMQQLPEGKLETYFQERVRGKLIFFSGADAEVRKNESEITVTAEAVSRRMRVSVSQSAAVTVPEEWIRRIEAGKQLIEEKVIQ